MCCVEGGYLTCVFEQVNWRLHILCRSCHHPGIWRGWFSATSNSHRYTIQSMDYWYQVLKQSSRSVHGGVEHPCMQISFCSHFCATLTNVIYRTLRKLPPVHAIDAIPHFPHQRSSSDTAENARDGLMRNVSQALGVSSVAKWSHVFHPRMLASTLTRNFCCFWLHQFDEETRMV